MKSLRSHDKTVSVEEIISFSRSYCSTDAELSLMTSSEVCSSIDCDELTNDKKSYSSDFAEEGRNLAKLKKKFMSFFSFGDIY